MFLGLLVFVVSSNFFFFKQKTAYEIKDYGGKISAKRTTQQTETALFWTSPLLAYQPLMRQLVTAKQMGVLDSARFMALEAGALNDAIIGVFDAKYHYKF